MGISWNRRQEKPGCRNARHDEVVTVEGNRLWQQHRRRREATAQDVDAVNAAKGKNKRRFDWRGKWNAIQRNKWHIIGGICLFVAAGIFVVIIGIPYLRYLVGLIPSGTGSFLKQHWWVPTIAVLAVAGVALLHSAWWPWLKDLTRKFMDWLRGWPLFASITVWVVLAVTLLVGLVWLWTGQVPFARITTPAPIPGFGNATGSSGIGMYDVLKIALTTVGGIGGVAFLVMKYQDGQRNKRDEINARMKNAIDQLGDEKSSVRIAGVYALTEIADRERGDYRQRVVDILCGYLRSTDRGTPITADSNADSAVEREKVDTTFDNDETPATTPDIPKPTFDDRPVESTIFSVMRTHLLKERRDKDGAIIVEQQLPDDQLWCDCGFDFHGAIFTEIVNLSKGLFATSTDFTETYFANEVWLNDTIFENDVWFADATFRNYAWFDDATFYNYAWFRNATFHNYAKFGSATFHNRTCFSGATFHDKTSFLNATFHLHIEFTDTTFYNQTSFLCVTFINAFPQFVLSRFSRKYRHRFPGSIPLNAEGLPEGARWIDEEDDDKTDEANKADE